MLIYHALNTDGVATSVPQSSECEAVACSSVGFPIAHQGPWLLFSLICEWVAYLVFSLGSAQTHPMSACGFLSVWWLTVVLLEIGCPAWLHMGPGS